jgi:hypothetical protein
MDKFLVRRPSVPSVPFKAVTILEPASENAGGDNSVDEFSMRRATPFHSSRKDCSSILSMFQRILRLSGDPFS